jgi:predicted phosphodiesterase
MKKEVYKSINKHYPYDRGYCSVCGNITTHKKGDDFVCKGCEMGLEEKLTPEDTELLATLKKSGLSQAEVKNLLKHKGVRNETYPNQPFKVKGTKFSIGVFGDTHIGSKFYDPEVMKYAAQVFNERKVNFVVHTGDITEGHYENKRQGSVFELTEIGGDAQVDRAVKELSQIKQPLYLITGNHEHNTFYKLCGFDVGRQIADRLPNVNYLGNAKGVIELPFGQKIEAIHPDGGSSYAISYKPQKIVESLEGGSKPAILLIGHFHKQLHMDYRNIQTFMTGTLQSQTTFMRNNHLAAHKGFYVIDFEVGKNGIKSISPTWYKAY